MSSLVLEIHTTNPRTTNIPKNCIEQGGGGGRGGRRGGERGGGGGGGGERGGGGGGGGEGRERRRRGEREGGNARSRLNKLREQHTQSCHVLFNDVIVTSIIAMMMPSTPTTMAISAILSSTTSRQPCQFLQPQQ